MIACGSADIITASIHDGIATHAIAMRVSLARRFLFHTDIEYSQFDLMSVISTLCLCNKSFGSLIQWRGLSRLLHAPVDPISCKVVPRVRKSWPQAFALNATFAVSLPVFKRDRSVEMMEALSAQTYQPSQIFFFQNQADQFPKACRARPGSAVFFMTYVPVGFLSDDYVLKTDDDFIPVNSNVLAEYIYIYIYLATARQYDNVIIGISGGTNHPSNNCGLFYARYLRASGVDHVAAVVLYACAAAKILHRFRDLSLVGGEDIALSLTNSIECGIVSMTRGFEIRRLPRDGHGQRNGPKHGPTIKKIYEQWENGPKLYDRVYCHYILGGYRPERGGIR
jgi:hypothetical protein